VCAILESTTYGVCDVAAPEMYRLAWESTTHHRINRDEDFIDYSLRNERSIFWASWIHYGQDLDLVGDRNTGRDGMSDDGTRESVVAVCGRAPQVRIIDNTGSHVSTGLTRDPGGTRAISSSDGAHTIYARDYVRECVKALAKSARITWWA